MRYFSLGAGFAFIMSCLGKYVADTFLIHRIALLGSWVGLVRTTNPGIAFGILLPPPLQTFAVPVALLLVLFLAWRTAHIPLQQAAFGLIAGGAAANILDRVGDRVVTDFIQVGSFPVFNIADSCITIGVFLLLTEAFLTSRRSA